MANECSGQACRKAASCPRSCSCCGRHPSHTLSRPSQDVHCTPYMYADDTVTLCAGANIETARHRAQLAADALTRWARSSKMVVSGEQTQVLVLSQWAKDAVDLSIRVAGAPVEARETLNLLGVTLDRLLHFGPHCKKMRRRTRPRLEHLRRLTGRDWGAGRAAASHCGQRLRERRPRARRTSVATGRVPLPRGSVGEGDARGRPHHNGLHALDPH